MKDLSRAPRVVATAVWLVSLTLTPLFVHAQAPDRYARTFDIRTDNSWLVTNAAPSGGWNSAPDFSVAGGGWVWAIAEGGGSNTIWHTSIAAGSSPNRIWFRKVVHLDEIHGAPDALRLTGHFDDDGEIWVNGRLVFSDGGGGRRASRPSCRRPSCRAARMSWPAPPSTDSASPTAPH